MPAGGIILLTCTAAAVAAANSPWAKAYADFWHTHLSVGFMKAGFATPREHIEALDKAKAALG